MPESFIEQLNKIPLGKAKPLIYFYDHDSAQIAKCLRVTQEKEGVGKRLERVVDGVNDPNYCRASRCHLLETCHPPRSIAFSELSAQPQVSDNKVGILGTFINFYQKYKFPLSYYGTRIRRSPDAVPVLLSPFKAKTEISTPDVMDLSKEVPHILQTTREFPVTYNTLRTNMNDMKCLSNPTPRDGHNAGFYTVQDITAPQSCIDLNCKFNGHCFKQDVLSGKVK